MPAGVKPTAIAAGADDSFAIGSNGNLYAWGYNGLDELGNGTTTDATTPVQVGLSPVAKPPTRSRLGIVGRPDLRHRPADPGAHHHHADHRHRRRSATARR